MESSTCPNRCCQRVLVRPYNPRTPHVNLKLRTPVAGCLRAEWENKPPLMALVEHLTVPRRGNRGAQYALR